MNSLKKNMLVVILVVMGISLIAYPVTLKIQTYFRKEALMRDVSDIDYEEMVELPLPSSGDSGEKHSFIYDDLDHHKFILEIEALNLKVPVMADKTIEEINKINELPSFLPDCAKPGERDNVVIAGHRSGPAGYFNKLDKLEEGDEILLRHTEKGLIFVYKIEWQDTVNPHNAPEYLGSSGYDSITLITCERVGTNTSALRLIVRAKFDRLLTRTLPLAEGLLVYLMGGLFDGLASQIFNHNCSGLRLVNFFPLKEGI